jgi:CRP-like cAMP-binding protein
MGAVINPLERLKEKLNSSGLWQDEILLKRNEYLKNASTKDTRVFLIQSGSLRMFINDEFEEHTIRFGYEGNLIAALDSFFSGNPSKIAIQALRKTSLTYMPGERFNAFIESDEEARKLWLLILSGLIVQQLEREVDLLTVSPAERYLRVLHRSPQLFQEIPHRFIASYLRMTPETLSRLKKS